MQFYPNYLITMTTHSLHDEFVTLLPWDIEMTVEEPVSDDDDGPPHRVSDRAPC
jgi:hypothetical protein